MQPTQKVYPADVELSVQADPGAGRPAKYPRPSTPSVSVVQMIDMLGPKALRRCSWRSGTKGMLSTHFATVRVRVADGTLVSHGHYLPGRAAWLVCEARSIGERKYYFANHPPNTPRAIKARWACEQVHQQLKDELDLHHYEGRSWLGLHHHALLTMIAFSYLQHRRLASALQARKKPTPYTPGPPPQPSLPAVRRALIATLCSILCGRCPDCGATINLRQLE